MSHPHELLPLENHERNEFQLERLILFTDAVFAIAITLLVIELKVPELHHRTEQAAWSGFLRLTPLLISFLLSFFIIAIYWVAHHRIFRFVRTTTPRLLWLNILFLLGIVFMPFTTAYQGEYAMLRMPWLLYSLNIIYVGLMQARLQQVLRRAPGLVLPDEQQHPDLDPVRPLLSALVFGLSLALAFVPGVHPTLLRLMPMTLGVVFAFYQRRYQRLMRTYVAAQQPPVPEPAAAETTEANNPE